MKELRKLIIKLEAAEEKASEADKAWEKDPESQEKEKAFDEAYKAEWAAFKAAKNEIIKLTGIDDHTASAMIRGHRDEIKKMIGL
jgi:hypothetical protein